MVTGDLSSNAEICVRDNVFNHIHEYFILNRIKCHAQIANTGTHSQYGDRVVGICNIAFPWHYGDVIMTTIASQITSLTVVYSIVYSDADQRKHQSSASLAFVWGIHRDRWIPRTKGQLRGKCFHLMTSSWHNSYCCFNFQRIEQH